MRLKRNRWPAALILILLAVSCGKGGGEGQTTSVRGTATTPLEETYVFAYRDDMDIYGPSFAKAGPTGPDGKFEMTLPPGRYFFVARKRGTGDAGGPVVSGDFKSRTIGPIQVGGGQPVDLSLLVEKKTGETRSLPAGEKTPSKTGISGRILDEAGKPVAKARVHVYMYSQMSERPKYVSNDTGPDGKYVILLPQGGTYYLAARNRFGGPPKLGDLYGRYDDGTIDPSSVVVRDGEILTDVDITLHKVW
jgi:hypothetical protein